jgi:hypothetical protein
MKQQRAAKSKAKSRLFTSLVHLGSSHAIGAYGRFLLPWFPPLRNSLRDGLRSQSISPLPIGYSGPRLSRLGWMLFRRESIWQMNLLIQWKRRGSLMRVPSVWFYGMPWSLTSSLLYIASIKTTKKMWDNLQATYSGKTSMAHGQHAPS